MLTDKNNSCCTTDTSSCCGKTVCGCWCLGLFTTAKFWLSALVAFVVLWGFDMYWQGHVMMPMYEETAVMWRPDTEMKTYLFAIQYALLAIVYTFLLKAATHTPRKREAVLMGIMISAPLAISALLWWNVMPFAVPQIPQYWAMGWLLQGILVAVVLKLLGIACAKYHAKKQQITPHI
jgi:hypothetical protein